ncbi:hypothetical protein SAMN05216389_12263 [Oceanobacillus limi]|uniref:Uncharacterized protein n=1 Tax=Oceanobacillus limi TaxID=930131 RepID=A0A1I0GL30_9BACI|nr:hypothetical protein [Oceanobacillus limi]SET71733.1 hypothetical protein SAMN05216389_12263 [Oceanobacillus limi]
MLETPLGNIVLTLNDEEINYDAVKFAPMKKLSPDVNGRYMIQLKCKENCKPQTIRCLIPSFLGKGEVESGESLEAVSFYRDNVKLTIGIDRAFDAEAGFGGRYLRNGLEYEMYETTKDRTITFGVCWIELCHANNDTQTWFGADPSYVKKLL